MTCPTWDQILILIHPSSESHEAALKGDVGRAWQDRAVFDNQHKLLGAGWDTAVLALLFWEGRRNFNVCFPGSRGPSSGGWQEGLSEQNPIPTNQPQSTPSFPSEKSSSQQPGVPSVSSSVDQLPPIMIQRN